MKKTININLSGQAFTIDEPAFEILHSYFETLKQKFSNEAERKEILEDIESRVAEVFQQRMGRQKEVVTEADVVHVISVLGKPEDIAGDEQAPAAPAPPAGPTAKVEKRLFRDTENQFVGGVISGLSHYFGWGDPTLIRVAVLGIGILSMFLHLHLGFPMGVVYFILLVVVPEANTASEKLQMRGEPVTLQNIEKQVKDAMNTTQQSVNNTFAQITSGKARSAGERLLWFFVKSFLIFTLISCFFMLLAVASVFFSFSFASSVLPVELITMVVSGRGFLYWAQIGFFLTFGIPLISIMYKSLRILTGRRGRNRVVSIGLTLAWIAGVIILGVSCSNTLRDFSSSVTQVQSVNLMQPSGKNLYVQLSDTFNQGFERHTEHSDFEISSLPETDYGFALGEPRIELAVSPDSNFHLEKVMFSRGRNMANAKANLETMRYKFSQTDSLVNLDSRFEIGKTGKWRAQRLRVRFLIPEGKQIVFGRNIDELEAVVKGDSKFDDVLFANKHFSAENGKIVCSDCNFDEQEHAEEDDEF
ncbi:MAG: PspC domain-containing protein [Chitinophagales bacterium]